MRQRRQNKRHLSLAGDKITSTFASPNGPRHLALRLFSLRLAMLWFILFYLWCLSPCSSSSQPVPFLDSWNSGEKISLSPGHATNMCTCWQLSRSCVSSLPSSSASKSPNVMCAEIPKKVAAQKGAFKLSQKQFFHTLRKHRKTFAGAKVQQKNDMCKEMPLFVQPLFWGFQRT